MTLASGLEADYAALIEKKNLSSLHYTKEASSWAQQLLAICDHCSDVLVATGFSKYNIGSMSAPVRWAASHGWSVGWQASRYRRPADDGAGRSLSGAIRSRTLSNCLRA